MMDAVIGGIGGNTAAACAVRVGGGVVRGVRPKREKRRNICLSQSRFSLFFTYICVHIYIYIYILCEICIYIKEKKKKYL